MLSCASVASLFRGCSSRRFFSLATNLVLSTASGLALAQQSPPNQSNTPPPPAAASTQADSKKAPEAATPPTTPVVTDPHQAQIIADTQKLLKLSQELKVEVAKSNKDTLSLTVIKKADEVEKLAKTLKEEMSKSH
jgi:sRNA-binding protein